VMEEIMKAKDKMALSWWWSAIPVYIMLCFMMKVMFVPKTTFRAEITLFMQGNPLIGIVLFILLPVSCAAINFYAIRQVYFWSGRPKRLAWLRRVVFNIIWFIFSLVILVICLIIKMKSI
jgi:hypothetical protein